jgi:hypothetical protein
LILRNPAVWERYECVVGGGNCGQVRGGVFYPQKSVAENAHLCFTFVEPIADWKCPVDRRK